MDIEVKRTNGKEITTYEFALSMQSSFGKPQNVAAQCYGFYTHTDGSKERKRFTQCVLSDVPADVIQEAREKIEKSIVFK